MKGQQPLIFNINITHIVKNPYSLKAFGSRPFHACRAPKMEWMRNNKRPEPGVRALQSSYSLESESD